MSDNKFSEEILRDVLAKIEGILVGAGFSSGSVEIKFKNTEALTFVEDLNLLGDSPIQLSPRFACHGCGHNGTIGMCCEFD